MVRDDCTLLDDGGGIPKSQRRGWRFDSGYEISSLHDRNLSGGHLPPVLYVGLSAFYLKQKVKKIGSVRRTGPSRMKM